MATQVLEGPKTERVKRRDSKPKRVYPCAVTVCIAAICSEGERELIILCSDRKVSYGEGSGSAEIGFKLGLAGAGWGAMTAGATSETNRILSFYRKHLSSVVLSENNFRTEIATALGSYRQWLANEYVTNWYFTTMEKLLQAKPSSRLGKDREQILKEARSIEFDEQLILSGYVEGIPYLFTVAHSGVVEHRHFACIGTGGWLSQASLLHREYISGTNINEALYLVYEAKKFSEKDDHVGPETLILVQEPPANSLKPALTIRTVSRCGIAHLEEQYRTFGLQPYRPTPYNQPEGFYV